jgi:hypothetical protein
VIGDGVSLLGQPFFQATDDLSGAPQCEGNRVSKDFSFRHGSLEHKENKRASRYILCTAPQEAQLPFLPHRQAALDYRPSGQGSGFT